ncbi:MAG: hypothetical protein R2849_02770 [Thermomicrobiales bacterium]
MSATSLGRSRASLEKVTILSRMMGYHMRQPGAIVGDRHTGVLGCFGPGQLASFT